MRKPDDPPPSIEIRGDELGADVAPEEMPLRAYLYWQRHLRVNPNGSQKTFINDETGMKVGFSVQGIKECLRGPNTNIKAKLIPAIEGIVRTAVYSGHEPHR